MIVEIQTLLGRFALFAVPFAVAGIAYSVAVILREPPSAQLTWALVGFVLAVVVLFTFLLVRWLRRRANAGKLEDGLSAGSARGNSRGEVEALRKSWKDSVAKLRTTSVAGGGKDAFASFPWFVIIGAPASGKSTLLRQSGLDFPVGDAAIRGLQGTRNCDWWFSNVGIFLDTAGRYISDESAEEWAQFLDLVRRGRAGAPINGVVVAIPATDLLQRSAEETDLEARRIRARLDELIDHLGVNFPVWIVVTKVDLIGGFVEFFGQADAATRQQMMGWTVGEDEGARFDLPAFERRFASTIHRLREIRPAMIELARLRDRPAAFGFPDELAAVGDPLGRMLQRIFEPNVYQETPLYRGVYVTSATQQGAPLTRAAARVREMLGAPAAEAESTGSVIRNAYFVKDLMHERIVRDREMTWTTPREMERGKLKRLGINLIGCAVGVFLLLLVLASGLSASSELGEVEAQVGALGSSKSGAVGRCDALWNAANHASDSNYRNLGLSQQKSLKLDLLARQREVYLESVLRAAVRQWRDDLAGAPVERGISAATEVYRQFVEFEGALAKAARRDEPAEKEPGPKDPGGKGGKPEEEDEEETAAPDPKAPPPVPKDEPEGDRAPKGFFAPAQRAAVEARLERLKAAGIVGTRKADRSPDPLLDAVWRNRGGAAEVAEDAKAVHDAFRAKVAEWVAKAGAAVTSIEQDTTQRSRYVTSLREGFVTECRSVLDQLETRTLEFDDLIVALQSLADAAAGGSGAADGEDAARRALLDSIGAGLAAVADSKVPLVPEAALRAMPGHDAVARWAGHSKSAGTGDADAATQAALAALAQKLRDLVERQRLGELVSRPWPAERSENVRGALDAIDADVAAREKVWAAEVVPHLAALAKLDVAAYQGDPARWGLAVELIEPVLRRNSAFRRFVEEDRPGTWKRFARKIVQERRAEFTRTALSHDLELLLGAAAAARNEDLRRFVCPGIAKASAAAARTQFETLVQRATEHWDGRCQSLPRYPGSDPWSYLERWFNTGGQVATLAKELQAAFGNWELDASLRTPEMEPLARDVWALMEPMRRRYEFYTSGFEEVRSSLGTLGNRSSWSPPADLAKLATEFGTTGRPAWRSRALDQIPAEALGDALRKDLLQAVGNAEDELVARIEKYFDRRWETIRRGLVAAVTESSKEMAETGAREFEGLVEDLKKLFGDDLIEQPGGRLAVTAAFRGTRTAIPDPKSLGRKVARAMTVEFDCKRLPYGKGGDGAVALPYIELEYKEEGAEAVKRVWTGKSDPLPVKWMPGRGLYFRLSMWNEAHTRSALFQEWSGPTCMVDAIRDGGGSGDLSWTGRGDYRESKAVFAMSASDPSALRDLLDPDTSDPTSRFAPDCVETLERR